MGKVIIGEGAAEKVEEVVATQEATKVEAEVVADYGSLIQELETKVGQDLRLILGELQNFQKNVITDLNTLAAEIEKGTKITDQINEDLNVQKICQIEGQTQYGQVLEDIKKLKENTDKVDFMIAHLQNELSKKELVPAAVVTNEVVRIEKEVPKSIYYWLGALSLLTTIALFI